MSLKKSSSNKAVSEDFKTLKQSGWPQKQDVVIALQHARKKKKRGR